MRQDSAGTHAVISARSAEAGLAGENVVAPLIAETVGGVQPGRTDRSDGSDLSRNATRGGDGAVGGGGSKTSGGNRAARSRLGRDGRNGPPPRRQGARRLATAPPHWRQNATADPNSSSRTDQLFSRTLPGVTKALRRGPNGLAGFLRDTILTALYTGRLAPGDRLPSIRELARTLGAAKRDVESAYGLLNQWGITEPRDRSGMFVARLSPQFDPPSTETGSWVAEVLAGAC